jgi:hypothetical protein
MALDFAAQPASEIDALWRDDALYDVQLKAGMRLTDT